MVIGKTEVLVKDHNIIVVPKALRVRVLQWYFSYFQHPGISKVEATISTVMYWPGICANVKRLAMS